MKKIILLIAALCCGFLLPGSGLAAEPTILIQDSGTNFTQMNATFTGAPAFDVSQAVKFTANPGWMLEGVLILGSDGWNETQKEFPLEGIFAVEIRDADLNLLYHFADSQLAYFTSPDGVRMASIEIPTMSMKGDFYVCFYPRGVISTLTELDQPTGNSYYFVRDTGQLLEGELALVGNQTLPINWIIRAVGE